jgi:hypothetical protein
VPALLGTVTRPAIGLLLLKNFLFLFIFFLDFQTFIYPISSTFMFAVRPIARMMSAYLSSSSLAFTTQQQDQGEVQHLRQLPGRHPVRVVLRLLRRLPAVEGAQAQGCQQVLLLLEALWRKTNTSLAPPFPASCLCSLCFVALDSAKQQKNNKCINFSSDLFFNFKIISFHLLTGERRGGASGSGERGGRRRRRTARW